MEIICVHEKEDRFEEFVHSFWEPWGNDTNWMFYQDCMSHSATSSGDLPSFYIAIEDEKTIGTYALLRNDLVSRQDLSPWLACLYVDPAFRGKSIGSRLLAHARREARQKGYDRLYLTTDHNRYYEKYGWTKIGTCYDLFGNPSSIYQISTTA
ncbi:GNAT family N-acetyltransferase [Sporosarcina sp. Te-1]|uniref:GNAT family N-acetyltransferase n=1 Tax=Sporosarcina sp. Te-1 TaxID=2818390 RepID=UPI001A9FD299|nr:GNAT family N-acetyltransferase [Sporosarcina sp. Te-1]QTD42538.1 GNAT family N-acetyltransferase [Sporosarcina sp. Te-1]